VVVKGLVCPSAPSSRDAPPSSEPLGGPCDYARIAGVDAAFYRANGLPVPPADARSGRRPYSDGTSNTMLMAEDAGRPSLYRVGRQQTGWTAEGWGWAHKLDLTVRGSSADGATFGGPCMINCTNDGEFYSFHVGGMNVTFADGSVRFLSASVRPNIVAALCTARGGEPIGSVD
jgi:prepilin-type processing-associated H-X9-DG protein